MGVKQSTEFKKYYTLGDFFSRPVSYHILHDDDDDDDDDDVQ